jgi:hypothetical protein
MLLQDLFALQLSGAVPFRSLPEQGHLKLDHLGFGFFLWLGAD